MAERGVPVTVRVWARLQDEQRAEVIDALFAALLETVSPGSRVLGSEPVVGVHREPSAVLAHLDVLPEDAERVVAAILDLDGGLPAGSQIEINGATAPFGRLQGLGLYLNGTQLGEDAYAHGDLQATADALAEASGDAGALWSHWMGPAETAFYFYGPDAVELRERLAVIIPDLPLLQRSRFAVLPTHD